MAFRGRRTSALCASRSEARQTEATLLQRLQTEDADARRIETGPATLKALFDGYVADLAARGKSAETIGRASQVKRAFEQTIPGCLDMHVSEIGDQLIFAFRQGRDRAGSSRNWRGSR